MVGMMRRGRLLVESPPKQLLAFYHLPSLEDVFLLLCRNDSTKLDEDEVSPVPSSQPSVLSANEQSVLLSNSASTNSSANPLNISNSINMKENEVENSSYQHDQPLISTNESTEEEDSILKKYGKY